MSQISLGNEMLSYDGHVVWCVNGTNTIFVKFTLDKQIWRRFVYWDDIFVHLVWKGSYTILALTVPNNMLYAKAHEGCPLNKEFPMETRKEEVWKLLKTNSL